MSVGTCFYCQSVSVADSTRRRALRRGPSAATPWHGGNSSQCWEVLRPCILHVSCCSTMKSHTEARASHLKQAANRQPSVCQQALPPCTQTHTCTHPFHGAHPKIRPTPTAAPSGARRHRLARKDLARLGCQRPAEPRGFGRPSGRGWWPAGRHGQRRRGRPAWLAPGGVKGGDKINRKWPETTFAFRAMSATSILKLLDYHNVKYTIVLGCWAGGIYLPRTS